MGSMVPLVGREHDVAAVTQRLVTSGSCSIVGPGGVGKSTLARAVVAAVGRPLVWLDVEAIANPADVLTALARALDTEVLPGEDPLAAVIAALDGQQVVVVLDGVEHLPGIDTLLTAVASALHGPWWLVTTRLSPAPPPAWRLRPLDLEGGSDAAARQLLRSLLDAAGEPGVLPADGGDAALSTTGGLPLAIELLAHRLVERAELDEPGPPGVIAGHDADGEAVDQVMVASVTRSLELVDPQVAACFRRLAVCGPRLTVADVAAATAQSVAGTRTMLARLHQVGLLVATGRSYDLLPPIRDVAWLMLGEAGELDGALDDAIAWAESTASAAAEQAAATGQAAQRVDNLLHIAWTATRCGHERAGPLATALFELLHRRMWNREFLALVSRVLAEHDGSPWEIEAARRAALAAAASSSADEAAAWLARADDAADATDRRARCRIESSRALLAVDAGDLELARTAADRSIELGADDPDSHGVVWLARHDLALIALQSGELSRCEDLAAECLRWSRDHDVELAWLAEVELAWSDLERGRWAEAVARSRRLREEIEATVGHPTEVSEETRAIELSAEPVFGAEAWDDRRDRPWWLRLTGRLAHAGAAPADRAPWVLRTAADVIALAESIPLAYPHVVARVLLGDAALAAGERRQAQQAYERALRDAVRHGYRLRAADALDGLAALASTIGDTRAARRSTGLADGVRAWCGAHPWPRPSLPVRPMVGEPPPEGSLVDGCPTDEALDAVTTTVARRMAEPAAADPFWSQLTRTEREVAQLAATGSSNNAIAEQLFVSRRTVESHLQRVYRKLDVHSRTQLANLVHRASDPATRTAD